MKNSILLLKTLLLSTSQSNIYRHTKEKKRRGKVVGAYIGLACLYAMLIGYGFAMCLGYGAFGLTDAIPVMGGLVICILAFVFTLFKTNGYLFNFKEYDMLMSLPFAPETVAGCKFLYMYLKSLPWYLCISIAMMAGYGRFVHPGVFTYILWLVLSFFLPIIPMLGAAFLGFIIARISTGFKKTKIVQTVLTMIFVVFCFSIRFIVEDMFRNDKVEATLEMISDKTDSAARMYPPLKWFADSVVGRGMGVLGALLLIVVSVILFAVIFRIVGRSYRNINSAMTSHAAGRKYKMTTQKMRSVTGAIAFKEFRRLTGSVTYMTNGAMGILLASLFSIVTLVIGFDKIIATVTQGAPIDTALLQPAIPFIIYFFIGMMSSTTCSPSLEGKNYWIVQSLPIEKSTLFKGKMLFNMYLTVPFMTFGIICLCISAKASVVDSIAYIILGIALCAFSTAWGCVCGVKHMRLDWENEVEVIKQGAAVMIYMFPNMFICMGLIVLTVVLGMRVNHMVLTLILTLIAAGLAALSYLRVMSLCRRMQV